MFNPNTSNQQRLHGDCSSREDISLYQDIPVVMSVDQMAKILKIGKNAAYDLVHSGAVKTIRTGRVIRITRKSLVEYLCSAPI